METNPPDKKKKRPRKSRVSDTRQKQNSLFNNVASKVIKILPNALGKWFTTSTSTNQEDLASESTDSSTDDEVMEPPEKKLRVSVPETLRYYPAAEEYENYSYAESKTKNCSTNTEPINLNTLDTLATTSDVYMEDSPKEKVDTDLLKRYVSEIKARSSILDYRGRNRLQLNPVHDINQLSSQSAQISRSPFYSGNTTYGGATSTYINSRNIQHVTDQIVDLQDANDSVVKISSKTQRVLDLIDTHITPLTSYTRSPKRSLPCSSISHPRSEESNKIRHYNTKELYVPRVASLLTLKYKAKLNESGRIAHQILMSQSSSIDNEDLEIVSKRIRLTEEVSTSTVVMSTSNDHSNTYTITLPQISSYSFNNDSEIIDRNPITSNSFSFAKPEVNVEDMNKIYKDVTSGEWHTVQQDTLNDWKCAACWVNNSSFINNCVCCSAQRPVEEKNKEKSTENVKDKVDLLPIAKMPKGWTCSDCWVKNDDVVEKCLCCGAKRKEEIKEKENKGGNKWNCPTCLVPNDDNVSRCVCCQTCKPETNDHVKIKYNFTLPEKQFKFGIDKSNLISESVQSTIVDIPPKFESETKFTSGLTVQIPDDQVEENNLANEPIETSDRQNALTVTSVAMKDTVKSEAVPNNTSCKDDQQKEQAQLPESIDHLSEQYTIQTPLSSDSSSKNNENTSNMFMQPENDRLSPIPAEFNLKASVLLNVNDSSMSSINMLETASIVPSTAESTPLFSGIQFGNSLVSQAPQRSNHLNSDVLTVSQAPGPAPLQDSFSTQTPSLASIQAPASAPITTVPPAPIHIATVAPNTDAPQAAASTAPMSFFQTNKSLTGTSLETSNFFLGLKKEPTVTTAAPQASTSIFTFGQTLKPNEEKPRSMFNFGANQAEPPSLFTSRTAFTEDNNIGANKFNGDNDEQLSEVFMATSGDVNNGTQMQATGLFDAGAQITSGNTHKPAFNFGSSSSFNSSSTSAVSVFGGPSIQQIPTQENIFGMLNQNVQPSMFNTAMQNQMPNQNAFGSSFQLPASGMFGPSNMAHAPSSGFNTNTSNPPPALPSSPAMFGSSSMSQTQLSGFNTNSSNPTPVLPSSPGMFGSSNMSQTPLSAFNTNSSNPTPSMPSSSGMFGSSNISQTPPPAFNTNPANPTPTFEPVTINVHRTFNFGATQQPTQPHSGMFNFTNQNQPPSGVYNFGQVQFSMGSAPNTAGRRVRKAVRRTQR